MAINIHELYEILEVMPASQNLMLVGKHGIGKSEILTRHFERQGIPVNTLFLGQMSDPGDLIGLPRMDENTGKTVFMPPYWFPTDGKPIVLFLDELNRARPEVLQTVMDLTLNRKLAGRELPEGSRLIAAVNDGDEYQLTDLDPALVSRFNIYTFRPSVQEWLRWADANKLDSRVTDFISQNPRMLDDDGSPEDYDRGLDKTPDRRAWKKVADCIAGTDMLNVTHKKLIAGIVGPVATQTFFSFLMTARILSGEDVLLNYPQHRSTLSKYRLHETAMVNESIFRYLEMGRYDRQQIDIIKTNLRSYIKDIVDSERNEALAHFASFLEKNHYPNALTFILSEVPKVYEILLQYIRNI